MKIIQITRGITMIVRKVLLSSCQAISKVIILGLYTAFAQTGLSETISVTEYLSNLPAELTLQENDPQKYCVTSHLHNRDISGNTINRILITAEYTRALDDGFVRWNNVRIGSSQDSAKPISESMLQYYKYMEDFSYSTKMPVDVSKTVTEEFYKDFPNDDTKHLIKSLVWDAVGIETFAWTYFDKLKLNELYLASDFEDFDVQLGDLGTIKMKDLKLKWAGISKMNDKICALIQYHSFSNPVDMISEAMTVKGRSLYWGCIWVSLEDKQIEYGTMNEDVIMEMTFTGNSGKKLINIQREVMFEKIQ